MPRIPVFDPQALRVWELVAEIPGNIRKVQWLWACDSPDPLPGGSHMHPVPQLLVAMRGTARIHSRLRPPIDLHPGEALVMAPGAWHHHEPLRPTSILYMQGLLHAHSDVALWTGEKQLRLLVPLEPARLMLHQLIERAPGHDPYTLCDSILSQFVQERALEWEIVEGPLMRMTLCFWHNLHKPITAHDILAASGLGTTQANRLFRAHHAVTPAEALEAARMGVARQLLREGMAISDVPRRCGYATLNRFERAFKRCHGASPREWRRGRMFKPA